MLDSIEEIAGLAGWPPRDHIVSGRKVRAPPDRVLGNAQALGRSSPGDGKWHRNIPPPARKARGKGEIGR